MLVLLPPLAPNKVWKLILGCCLSQRGPYMVLTIHTFLIFLYPYSTSRPFRSDKGLFTIHRTPLKSKVIVFLQPGLHPSESPPCIYIYPVYIYIYTLIWTIHMLFILLHLNHVQHFLNLFYKVSLTYFSGICLTSVIGSTKGGAIPLRTFFNQWKLQQISLSLKHEIKRASSIFLPFCIPYVRISGEMWLSTHALAKTLKRKTAKYNMFAHQDPCSHSEFFTVHRKWNWKTYCLRHASKKNNTQGFRIPRLYKSNTDHHVGLHECYLWLNYLIMQYFLNFLIKIHKKFANIHCHYVEVSYQLTC